MFKYVTLIIPLFMMFNGCSTKKIYVDRPIVKVKNILIEPNNKMYKIYEVNSKVIGLTEKEMYELIDNGEFEKLIYNEYVELLKTIKMYENQNIELKEWYDRQRKLYIK